MHVDTKSDVTIIPLSFAELLGLKIEVKAIVNGSEGYLSRVKVRIGEKEFVTTVFCESDACMRATVRFNNSDCSFS